MKPVSICTTPWPTTAATSVKSGRSVLISFSGSHSSPAASLTMFSRSVNQKLSRSQTSVESMCRYGGRRPAAEGSCCPPCHATSGSDALRSQRHSDRNSVGSPAATAGRVGVSIDRGRERQAAGATASRCLTRGTILFLLLDGTQTESGTKAMRGGTRGRRDQHGSSEEQRQKTPGTPEQVAVDHRGAIASAIAFYRCPTPSHAIESLDQQSITSFPKTTSDTPSERVEHI